MLYYPGGMLESSFSWGIEKNTNYQAKILACLKSSQLAKEGGHKDLQIFGDSEILINVLNTDKYFRNFSLNGTMQRIQFIVTEFDFVSFFHELRELNKKADSKANRFYHLPTGMLTMNEGPGLKHQIPQKRSCHLSYPRN